MKIRIYNSVTTQGIAIEYVNQDTTMFLTPFFGAKFVHQPTLLIKKVVGTAETVLYKLPADLKDFKMLGLAVSEGILSVYISGEKRWSGYIGNLDVNMIEKTSLGSALFDDLKILPYRASDSEMKRLYSLRAQIDKQGNVMVPFLTEDTSRVEFDDLVVGSGETVVHSITPSSRLTLSAYINLEE